MVTVVLGVLRTAATLQDAEESLCQQLVDAAGTGDVRRINDLLRRGARITWADEVRALPSGGFWCLVSCQSLFTGQRACVTHATPQNGVTVLHQAAFTGNAALAVEMLRLGADVTAATKVSLQCVGTFCTLVVLTSRAAAVQRDRMASRRLGWRYGLVRGTWPMLSG